MPTLEAPAEALSALSRVLRRCGYRWYVFGAQAVILWGEPRMSADLDVTVEMPSDELMGFVSAMEEAGFRLRIENVAEFVEETRVLPFLYGGDGFPVDVILAGSGLETLILDRVRMVELAETTIPVISPEDLIVTKILAGREKDLSDVRGILEQRSAELDLEYVRQTVGLLEQALGQSDLLPLLEAQIRESGE